MYMYLKSHMGIFNTWAKFENLLQNNRVMSSMQSSSGSVDSGLFEPWSWEVGWDHNKDKNFTQEFILKIS